MTSSFDKPWQLKGNEAARYSPSQKLSLSRCYQSNAADLFHQNNTEEALKYYEKAFKVLLPSLIDSEDVRKILQHEETRVLLKMASCKHKLHLMKDVKDLCWMVIKHGFQDCLVKAYWRRGILRFQDRDWDGAREDFQLCLKSIEWEREELERLQKENRSATEGRISVPKDRLQELEKAENPKSYAGSIESDPGLDEFVKEVPHIHNEDTLKTLVKSCQIHLQKVQKALKEYKQQERAQLAGKLF